MRASTQLIVNCASIGSNAVDCGVVRLLRMTGENYRALRYNCRDILDMPVTNASRSLGVGEELETSMSSMASDTLSTQGNLYLREVCLISGTLVGHIWAQCHVGMEAGD